MHLVSGNLEYDGNLRTDPALSVCDGRLRMVPAPPVSARHCNGLQRAEHFM